MIVETKKGSALLIVLGMVAFMIVSAVSFSIFMRQSRVPSSHLRREVSSRYLLKAALANAIARIDGQFASQRKIGNSDLGDSTGSGYTEGVFDSTYPGLNNESDIRRNGDYWSSGRVFMPFGALKYGRETGNEQDPSDYDDDVVTENQTVSTLTLEALAYLPPAIINEVRIDSRRTRTARWSNLSYELGRYAFTAVNVSDCFDINRLYASMRRTSAPGERINMSGLFESPAAAEKFDSILERSGDVPFVSLADFNIVAQGTEFSPFSRYIGSQQSYIYRMSDANSLSNALFVTDTWFPENDTASRDASEGNQNAGNQQNQQNAVQKFDLAAGGDNQPFKDFSEKKTLLGFASESPPPIRTKLQEFIGFVGTACLYDYLDGDSVPLSLCIPSAEAVPMVSSLCIANQFNLKIETEERNGVEIVTPATEDSPEVKFVRNAKKYKLTGIADSGSIMVAGTVLYPFLRMKDKGYPENFKLESLVKIWWAPKDVKSRLASDAVLYPSTKEAWASSVKDGVVTVYSSNDVKIEGFSVKDMPQSSQEAVFRIMGNVTLPALDMPLMWYVEEWEQNGDDEQRLNEKKYYSLNDCHNENSFRPYAAQGQADGWWKPEDPKMTLSFPTFEGGKWSSRDPAPHNATALPETEYVMHVALWVRVIDGDGNTVDMAPARPSDDSLWIAQGGGDEMNIFEKIAGGGSPILEFRGTVPVKYTKETCDGFGGGVAEPMEWNSLFCCDPKFNWAPENWFKAKENFEGSLEGSWVSKAESVVGTGNRDKDVFMAVSDQEYLQSIGELGFIPDLGWRIGNKLVDYEDRFTGASMSARSGAGDCVCNEYFWRTYSPIEDPVYDFDGEMEVISGQNDFRVNPFTGDLRVMMAAIANTPYDYYVASTNQDSEINRFASMELKDSLKHSFCKDCPSAYWDDDLVRDIAQEISRRFREKGREKPGADWKEIFDEMPWFDGKKGAEQLTFLEVELDKPLYGVDRKFLYSYWRECFQNRQQLFLVFIRAEPLSVGGASGDAVGNAQLGARGVALVWRDPAVPSGGGNRPKRTELLSPQKWQTLSAENSVKPHRTRVLFYHQFD